MQPALKLSTTLCGLGSMEALYITTTSPSGQTCRLVTAAQLKLVGSCISHHGYVRGSTQQSLPALYLA